MNTTYKQDDQYRKRIDVQQTHIHKKCTQESKFKGEDIRNVNNSGYR